MVNKWRCIVSLPSHKQELLLRASWLVAGWLSAGWWLTSEQRSALSEERVKKESASIIKMQKKDYALVLLASYARTRLI